MKNKISKQENFWSGEFAKGYINRNNLDDPISNISSRSSMFTTIISKTVEIKSAIELGANIGLNLVSLKNILPDIKLSAIEINTDACEILKKIKNIDLYQGSILDFKPSDLPKCELTFTSGVLIHINPDSLSHVYDLLYSCSKKYILIAEYYNPTPVMIPYHGEDDLLFKRDFAGEMLDTYPDLTLIDYGFIYRRDNNFPLGDITWFLLEKNK